MKFNNDETKLIKIGDKYFKVKELGWLKQNCFQLSGAAVVVY
jgi:hypothetical protein